MVGWYHRLNGHEFEQILGDSEGQEGLVYCSPWGCKGSNTTSIQFSSVTQSCPTLRPHELQHARPSCPSPTPKVHPNPSMSIGSVMPSNHLILCHPLLLLPSIFPSIRVFSNESPLHIRWPSIGASASASVLPMDIQG